MTQTGRNNLEQIDIRLMGQIIQPLARRTTVEPFERGSDVIVDYSHTVWTECAPIEGKFAVPFAIQIPSVTLNGKPLPASATESKGCFGIRYEVFAHMRRGRLRTDYKFGSLVNYMAGKRPEASSPLRQSAYENGGAIPGPKEDPDYWKTLEPVTIHGTVSNHREVEIECQVRLHAIFLPPHLTI
ncbi:hypothetical protein FIBSPDRAFT_572661 [Athelia psychrophila]|uniref:Arrestin-like N-terminal domain-containing protein n=1 Tax=Athelia psychrophila TaxID=1759441 RepID=A0A166HMW5_9AGAM|nr:hypothetical protein FIBSPDRAFT_572661 [Fibularhizoctonia sp. CBS 109695]